MGQPYKKYSSSMQPYTLLSMIFPKSSQYRVWREALVPDPSMPRALGSNNVAQGYRAKPSGTLHRTQAASVRMHPFLHLKFLLQATSERNLHSQEPKFCYFCTKSPGSQKAEDCPNIGPCTRDTPHQTSSLPGDSLQS